MTRNIFDSDGYERSLGCTMSAARGLSMLQRRTFVKYSSGASFFCFTLGTGRLRRAFAQPIPAGTLDPVAIPRYQTPMLIPPAMPRVGQVKLQDGTDIDYYEVAVRQFSQQILPPGLPPTTVWGYGPKAAPSGPASFHSPAMTIEAKWGEPARVKWINEMPADPALHWAGDPEEWFLPDARDIPAGQTTEGTWYEFFSGNATARLGAHWDAGSLTVQYLNADRPATKWHQDHVRGMADLNVHGGLAGFYLLRGGPDDVVRDTRTGRQAVLPGPAPSPGDRPGTAYYELPIAIQDRSFNADGSLFHPDARTFLDGVDGADILDTAVSPSREPELFGNTMVVNGRTWPFQVVQKRRYRLRLLNSCQSRFLILDFGDITGVKVWQIGNKDGFLATPRNITGHHQNRIFLAPAERVDCIVDFTYVPVGHHQLRNVGPDEPYYGGTPGEDFPASDPSSTGQVLQFRVVPATTTDPTTPPPFLQLPALPATPHARVTRRLALLTEMSSSLADTPSETLLGVVNSDPGVGPAEFSARHWDAPTTENPQPGTTEIWEFYNATGDAQPMRIEGVRFEVLGRQDIFVDEDARTVMIVPTSSQSPPEPWETGFTDTVSAYPNQVTRVRMTFDTPGQFV